MNDKKRKNKNRIYNVIMFIAVCVILYSGYNIGVVFYQNHKQDQQKSKLEEFVSLPLEESNEEPFIIDWDSLYAINKEIVGWIHIPDTSISYPIVQGSDNSFYLTHDYEKNYLYSGAIFMDTAATPNFADKNTIIYGHNVLYGTMFAEIENFKEAEFFQSHPYVYIFTREQNYQCEILGMYTTQDTSDAYITHFDNDNAYRQYLDNVQNNSIYQSSFNASVEDHIITLSTCSYEKDANDKLLRYVVHAKLVPLEGEYMVKKE